jgi:hypothetical protein
VPWLRWLVAGLSLWRPWRALEQVHVEYVVDKVALGQVFLQLFWFSHQFYLTAAVHTHISPLGDEQKAH